jgi:hypothetical protein
MARRFDRVERGAHAREVFRFGTLGRNSRMHSTSRSVVAGTISIPSFSRCGSSTKLPMPCRVSMTLPACRREIASRMTVRLTLSVTMSCDSVGSLSPGFSALDAICSVT